jgi:hypothetical protein
MKEAIISRLHTIALSEATGRAFKMYIYLCLTADRSSGRIAAGHADLSKVLGKEPQIRDCVSRGTPAARGVQGKVRP